MVQLSVGVLDATHGNSKSRSLASLPALVSIILGVFDARALHPPYTLRISCGAARVCSSLTTCGRGRGLKSNTPRPTLIETKAGKRASLLVLDFPCHGTAPNNDKSESWQASVLVFVLRPLKYECHVKASFANCTTDVVLQPQRCPIPCGIRRGDKNCLRN